MYIHYLEQLIRFKSITPSSAGCIEYIETLLREHNFATEVKIFGDDKCLVTNLYATYGEAKPNICFVGHIDVVPAGDLTLWNSDPFVASRVDDRIYGRGAVDMKGAIACFLFAALEFIKPYPLPKGSISLLITSDEEGGDEYGVQEMLKYLYGKSAFNNIDFAIVGEPTSELEIGDTVKIGRRGSINFNLTVRGVSGHVAYPEQAKNPLPCAVDIIHTLVNRKLDQGSEFFSSSNLEITSIDVGNNTTNVIPSRVSVCFNIRFNELHSADGLTDLVESIVKKFCSRYKVEYNLDARSTANSFIQKPVEYIEKFAEIVADTTKVQPKLSTSGGTSDARFVKDYCPVVEFGLLSATAHKVNEHTKITDLQKLYDVYHDCLVKFLG